MPRRRNKQTKASPDIPYEITTGLLKTIGVGLFLYLGYVMLFVYVGVILYAMAWALGIAVVLAGFLYLHYRAQMHFHTFKKMYTSSRNSVLKNETFSDYLGRLLHLNRSNR